LDRGVVWSAHSPILVGEEEEEEEEEEF